MADRALLVGINAYPRQPLRGCINDVQDIAKLLVEARGFASGGIRTMIDGDASAAAIKQALAEWLVKGAAPGDRLVFHYSGHGSRLLDKAGEIHDVICPVDFDFTLERSLSDEDFRKLFAPIPAGSHFSWISDSCHSGDLARSFGMRDVLPRYLPPPPEIAAAIEKALSRRAMTRGLVVADEHVNGVLIAGCKSTEESADAKINGRYNGALTYYLVKQLRSTKGLETDIETIVGQTGKMLEDERYEQHPQVRGQPTLRKLPFVAAMQAAAAAAQQQAAQATASTAQATAGPSAAVAAQPPVEPAAVATATAATVAAATATPLPAPTTTTAAVTAAPTPSAAAETSTDAIAADDELAGATSMTLDEVAEARGWREREDVTTRGPGGGAPTTMSKAELNAIPNEKISAMVSEEAHALVIAAEIGSKAEYDKKYKYPEWPQGESGVTIGFGSDLGYFDQTSMKSAWGGLIEDANYNRLEKCCGLKGSKASAALGSVKDISVPWEKADVAYHRHEVPEYGRQVIGAFPNAMELHPHSFGALFSLVYNRGPGMGSAGDDKRKEMRNIRDLMAARRFDKVPAEFRAMKRLWVGKFAGLVKRREDEAKLFEKGLKAQIAEQAPATATTSPVPAPAPVAQSAAAPAPVAMPPPTPPAATIVAAATPPSQAAAPAPSPTAAPQSAAPASAASAPTPPPAGAGLSPAVQSALDQLAAIPVVAAAGAATAAAATGGAKPEADGPTVTESRGMRNPEGDGSAWGDDFESDQGPVARGDEWSAVHWPKNDEDSTEYRHLADHPLKGSTFDFTADDVELLIAANAFEPTKENGKIMFGLRGAELVVAAGANAQDKFKQIGRKSLRLKETRPDHQHFRCVIGAYDPATRELSGFIASTVPCRQAIIGYINGGEGSNMLPSGCYDYVCGPHKDRQGCLRENEDFTVLRTKKNPEFDVKDNWDLNFPADNLHPAFSNKSAEFSSWGCQTIRGNHNKADGSFSGEYNEFRNVLGLKPKAGSHGLKFSYMMVTGLEAAIASDLRKNGRAKDAGEVMKSLGRLRHGSRGDRVKALQAKLGIATDGVFNAAVRKALAAQQIKVMGWADGLYWPEMDELLGFDVFKPVVVPAVIAPTATSAPAVAAATPVAPAPAPQPPPAMQPPANAQPAPVAQPVPQPRPLQVAAPVPPAPLSAPVVIAASAPAKPAITTTAAIAVPASTPQTAPASATGGSGASAAIQATLDQMTGAAAAAAPVAAAVVTAPATDAAAHGGAQETESRGPSSRAPAAAPEKPAARPAKRRGKRGRLALVIGNSAYRSATALRNPVHDAALMTRHLVRNKFTTIFGGVDPGDLSEAERRRIDCAFDGLDLDRHQLFQRVQEFLGAIEEGSEALIYYAGHGIQIGDQNYLVPVDTTLASDDPIAELVPLNWLIENAVAKAGSSGKVIVLLDACRNNPFTQRQLQSLSDKLAARAMSADGGSAPRAYVAGGGLAPSGVGSSDETAATFISYATAPGAVAFDGAASARNSPFAEALGRHIGTRGLPLGDVVRRAGRDVQDRVRTANHGRVQDPWISTDLKDDYFIKPRSFFPVFAMALMGLVAGLITCFLLFQGESNRLIDPFNGFWPWAVGLLFGLVTAAGTLLWGSGKLRDAVYAAAGCSLSFMLALTVLQLIFITGRTPVGALPQDLVQLVADVSITFKVLAGVAAVFMLLGTLMCWPRSQWSVHGFLRRGYYLLLPVVLGLSLFSLQRRLGVSGQIGLIMVSLISGVLFTAGTVLALKPQHSVFRGFGALTGAITIGLAMPIFFDLYFQIEPLGVVDPKLLALGLGGIWFGLLGAQIGYCFAFYVPEHEPLES